MRDKKFGQKLWFFLTYIKVFRTILLRNTKNPRRRLSALWDSFFQKKCGSLYFDYTPLDYPRFSPTYCASFFGWSHCRKWLFEFYNIKISALHCWKYNIWPWVKSSLTTAFGYPRSSGKMLCECCRKIEGLLYFLWSKWFFKKNQNYLKV